MVIVTVIVVVIVIIIYFMFSVVNFYKLTQLHRN